MRIQHGHESQDLTKVTMELVIEPGIRRNSRGFKAIPGFQSQYLLLSMRRDLADRLPTAEGIIMPVQGDTNET